MGVTMKLLGALNKAGPKGPAEPSKSGFDWRIVLGLVVGVPLLIALIGLAVLTFGPKGRNPMIGKCVNVTAPIVDNSAVVLVTTVSCDTSHTGKVVAVIKPSKDCAGTTQPYLHGTDERWCVDTSQ